MLNPRAVSPAVYQYSPQSPAVHLIFGCKLLASKLDRTRLAGRHNTKLDFNKLFYLAIHRHELRKEEG